MLLDKFAFWRTSTHRDEVFERPTPIPKVSRTTYRPTASFARSYMAAMDRPHYGYFGSGDGSADYELSVSLRPMRNKIRAMARNSSVGKRALQLIKDNVVGPEGFTFRSRVRLTTDPKRYDRSLNDRVEAEWLEFSKSPTVCGTMDMVDLEKLCAVSWYRDGEILIEIVESAEFDTGFRFNPFESDLLDETLNTVYPPTGNQIRMGVEFDQMRRPVAYHILNQHPGDLTWQTPITNKRYRRVPADRIIHVFEPIRAGQTRGEPPMSSIPNMVKMLDGYREAEVTGRRVKSSSMGFITQPEDAPANSDLDGMADQTDEVEEVLELFLEPGALRQLPPGRKFEQFDPGGAMTDYQQFEGQVKTDISMGASISPVSLGYETAKLSYSTHRGIIAEDRDMYRGVQSFIIRKAMMPMFTVWLYRNLAYNVASTVPPSRMMAILASMRFQPRGWDYIDPAKEIKAENEALAARTTSLSRVTAKRGIAFSDLVAEIAEDEALLGEYGLTQVLAGGNTGQTTSGDDDEGDAEIDEA
jgi:lambda family phage portal protein